MITQIIKGSLVSGYRLLASGCIILGLIFVVMMANLPSVTDQDAYQMQVPMQVLSQEGMLLGEFGRMNRIPIPIQKIPPALIKAVIAIEDRHFYEHGGVNLLSLLRAARQLIVTGHKSQGASTITMQVAIEPFTIILLLGPFEIITLIFNTCRT